MTAPIDSSLKREAALKRLELLLGSITKQDVITWADNVIMQMDRPPVLLLDVSLAGNRSSKHIASLLKELSEGADRAEVEAEAFRHYCGFLYEKLESSALNPDEIARRLYSIAWQSDFLVPEEYVNFCTGIDDLLALTGSVESLRDFLRQFEG